MIIGRKIARGVSVFAALSLLAGNLAACGTIAEGWNWKDKPEPNKMANTKIEKQVTIDDYDCPKTENANDAQLKPSKSLSKLKMTPQMEAYFYAPPPPPPSPVVVGGQKTMPKPVPFPQMVQDTEKYPIAGINGFKQTKEQPVSTFAIETDTASYTNARRMINAGQLPPTDAIRVEEFLNYFKYDYKGTKDKNIPFATNITYTQSPWHKDKQIVHIGLKGFDNAKENRPPLNLVLLMDVSGSMSGEDRLELAKKSVLGFLPKLNKQDKVSIVVYAGASGIVLEPTKGDKKRDIACALQNLHAGGSTAGGAGLKLAYDTAKKNFDKDSINRVILMSDGDFNVGITDPRKLKDYVSEQSKSGIYLSIFGFGGGNYNDDMMQSLAQNGNGIAAYIDNENEAKRVLHDEFTATMFPIANDVKAQIEFNPNRVAEWRLVGYETRALNREDFNNDAIDAGEIGAGHQVTAIYEITPIGGKLSVDPLRYQNDKAQKEGNINEIGFLRLRYKLPGESQSKLIERPLNNNAYIANLDDAPQSTQLALAVAGFAQKLRNDPWVGTTQYDDIIELAETYDDEKSFGLVSEFINLVEKSKKLERMK